MEMDSESLTVEVAGKRFHITKTSASSIPGSVLSSIASGETTETKFDRDPGMFRHILNAYRTGMLHIPRDVCPCAFKQEMIFWKIPLKTVAPCCWKSIHEVDNELETISLLVGEEDKLQGNNVRGNKVDPKADCYDITDVFESLTDTHIRAKRDNLTNNSLRTRLWLLLEEPGTSTAAKVWCFVYIFMAVVSVVVYVIWAEPDVRVDMYFQNEDTIEDLLLNDTSFREFYVTIPETVKILLGTDPHPAMFAVDVICTVFFFIEAMVHFIVCPFKRRYFCDPLNIIKVGLLLTMLITTVMETNKHWLTMSGNPNITLGKFYFGCKSFNVLRLLLIFRLRKIYNGLHIMLLSLVQSIKQLVLLGFCFGIAVLMFGCLVFSAEIESGMFSSTRISMWWALITMTTIGYGDYYPTTTYGYIIGSLCAITGLLVIALPVASIAGTFSDMYSRNADLQKHKLAVQREEKRNQKTVEKIKQ